MNKHKAYRNRLDLLIKSYLIITLVLGLYNFFNLVEPTTTIIFLGEFVYLALSLVLVLIIFIQLNLFLIKIKRNNFRLIPIKLQVSRLDFWAIIFWSILISSYGLRNGIFIFGGFSLIIPSFLSRDLLTYLATTQFSLAIYLLSSMIVIFIYVIVFQQLKIITIIPNDFYDLSDNDNFLKVKKIVNPRWKLRIFTFFYHVKTIFLTLKMFLILLGLELKHLKTLALRRLKKETTPPLILYC